MDPNLRHVFTYNLQVTAPPHFLGVFPDGIRLLFHSPGGSMIGHGPFEGFEARSLPQAADLFLVQPDDIGTMDVLATLQLSDGRVIVERHKGKATLPPGTYRNMIEGKSPCGTATVRAAFEFISGYPDHAQICRDIYFGVATIEFDTLTVNYRIFAAVD